LKTYRNPPDVHAPLGSYIHQIEISGPERLLAISGQVGQRVDCSLSTDPYEQLDQALENVFLNLRAAGMEVKDLVKLTFFLVGEWDNPKRRAVVAKRLGEIHPCMTTVYVTALAVPIYKVEVDAWASKAD
jgi:2-iminobutanoate/2-iminopropanoate deaminase